MMNKIGIESFGEQTLNALLDVENVDLQTTSNNHQLDEARRQCRETPGVSFAKKEKSQGPVARQAQGNISGAKPTTRNDKSDIDKYFEDSLVLSQTTHIEFERNNSNAPKACRVSSKRNPSVSNERKIVRRAQTSKHSKLRDARHNRDWSFTPDEVLIIEDASEPCDPRPTTSYHAQPNTVAAEVSKRATGHVSHLLSIEENKLLNYHQDVPLAAQPQPVIDASRYSEVTDPGTGMDNADEETREQNSNASEHIASHAKHATVSHSGASTNSADDRCQLSAWALPTKILEKYESRGLTKMFPWQVECLSKYNVLVNQKNLVYSAPTSAGKTLVSEILVIKTVLELNKKVIFILPFVSVVREKMFYFQDLLSSSGVRVDGFMGERSPAGGLSATHIAIATIEKANSLINRLMEEGGLSTLGAVVVDELHLIGDPNRGYLLELLLTKLKYMTLREEHVHVQIIGMSATLPNLPLLAEWLDADLYETDFRPIPLEERCKINTTIYDSSFVPVHKIEPSPELPNDKDNIAQLCIETIGNGHSTLIFCGAKNKCEELARHIAQIFCKLGNNNTQLGQILREQLDSTAIEETLCQLKRSPAGLDKVLERTVSFGVAYHHAGLTMDERDIIEGSFRTGSLRVLIATSTLSSGVNLPARRVIVRSIMFYGRVLNSLSYRQMIGRAGRMGKDTAGESILICNTSERQAAETLMSSPLEPVTSCLHGSGPLIRALLEAVASEVAYTSADIKLYIGCTLAHFSQKMQLANLTKEAMSFLTDNEFISDQKLENEESRSVATALGKACLASSISPENGLFLFEELQRARKCLVLETELHIIYLVTPFNCSIGQVEWTLFFNIWKSLSDSDRRVSQMVGIEESFLVSALSGVVKPGKQRNKHLRFFMALALHDLVHEVSLTKVSEKYGCNRGILQNLQQSSSTFAGIVTQFCKQLGWDCMELLFSQFRTRLHFGVNRDLLDLLRLPMLNGLRARSLHKEGITSVADLAAADERNVERALHKALPFESTKEQDGEHALDAAKRNQLRSIFVTGRDGLTPYQAAVLLIQEARTLLQHELGVKEVHWAADSTKSDTSVAIASNISKSLTASQSRMCDNSSLNVPAKNEGVRASIHATAEIDANEDSRPTSRENNVSIPEAEPDEISKNEPLDSNVSDVDSQSRPDSCVTVRFDKKLGISPVDSVDNLEWSTFRKSCDEPRKPPSRDSSVTASPVIESVPNEDQEMPEAPAIREIEPEARPENGVNRSFSRSPSLFDDTCSVDGEFCDEFEKNIDGTLGILGTTDVMDRPSGEINRTLTFSATTRAVSPSTIRMRRSKKTDNHSLLPKEPATTVDIPSESRNDVKTESKKNDPFSEELNFSWDSCDSWNVEDNLGNKTRRRSMEAPNPRTSRVVSPSSTRDILSDSSESSVFRSSPATRIANRRSLPPENAQSKHPEIRVADDPNAVLNPSMRSLSNSSRMSLDSNNSDEYVIASQELAVSSTCRTRSRVKLQSMKKVKIIRPENSDNSVRSKRRAKEQGIESRRVALIRTNALRTRKVSNRDECSTDSVVSNSEDDSPAQRTRSMQSLHKRTLNSTFASDRIDETRRATKRAKHSVAESKKSDSEQEVDFDVVDVVNVARNSSVFNLFAAELRNRREIAVALARGRFVDETQAIGARMLSTLGGVEKKKKSKLDETCVHGDRIVNGTAICWDKNVVYYLSFENRTDGGISLEDRLQLLRDVFSSSSLRVRCYGSKETYKVLYRCCNIAPNCRFVDPKVVQWLTEPDCPERSLGQMASIYFPQKTATIWRSACFAVTGDELLLLDRDEAAAFAVTTWHVTQRAAAKLASISKILSETFYDVEMKVISILARLELSGIGINFKSLEDLSVILQQELTKLEKRAYNLAGRKFNFTSSKEVAQALGLYRGKKVSTNKAVLETIDNPISKLVMCWRKLNTTQKKMVFPLLNLSRYSSRIHGICVTNTVTGRIAMHEPNLQNVPRDFDNELGSFVISMRTAFAPNFGSVMLSADYCQVELRILAHFSNDSVLYRIMRTDCDIFKSIAAQWHNLSETEIDDNIRQRTKQVCYGIIYGMGCRTLANQLNVTELEARQFIESFMGTYPNVNKWLEHVKAECRENGYVTTLMGRRRLLPELKSDSMGVRSKAERQAVNTKIQGSAADLAKKAMVLIDDRLHQEYPDAPKILTDLKQRRLRSSKETENRGAHLVLQLHDELLYEVNALDLERVARIVKESMEEAYKLAVPLPVKIKVGPTWGDLTEYNIPKTNS